MKQTLFALLFTLFLLQAFNGHAQISKGETMLGATISYTSDNNTYKDPSTNYGVKTQNFVFTPQFGVGLGKNWVIGIQASYGKEKRKDINLSNNYDENLYTVGLFARKFYTIAEKFGFFAQVNTQAGWDDTKPNGAKEKTKLFSANGQPGFYFKPGKKLILETTIGMLGFSNSKTTYENSPGTSKDNRFQFSFIDGVSVGVKFIL